MMEGNEDRSLLLLYPMNTEPQIQAFEHKVEALISAEPDLFLVEVKIKPTNNIKVFIDGDQGVSIEKFGTTEGYIRKLKKVQCFLTVIFH
jgi:hypothetical protein